MISILFGAGASTGSELVAPAPPLGKQLFDQLEKLGGVFSSLPNEAKQIFREDGFEIAMTVLSNNSNMVNRLQKELAIYLSGFVPSDNSLYIKFFKQIGLSRRDICLMTLNYDLLIEMSLGKAGFRNVGYDNDNGDVNLLKIHGSSNWIPKFPGAYNFQNNNFYGVGTYVETENFDVLGSHDEVKSWCAEPRNDSLSPVMSMYNPSKQVVINSSCVKRVQESYALKIDESGLVIIIGVAYVPHDEHVWGSLLSTKSKVIVVDPYPSANLIGAINKRENFTFVRKFFNDALPMLVGQINNHRRQNRQV